MSDLSIRTATLEELKIIVDWAAAEGWNPGLDDVDAFHGTDPEGFLIGWQGDRPVSCISVVAYDPSYAFLGFYICHPDYRGRNYGLTIWHKGLERVGERTIGLDGVVDQQANYARSGFVFSERNIRFAGTVSVDAVENPRIVEATDATPDLIAYDSEMVPTTRSRFLHQWINPDHRRTLLWREDGAICGYGTIRPCREGFKIGPLFADKPDIAEALFRNLVAPISPAVVILDVPEPNQSAVAMAKRYGLEQVFETARMYRGAMPTLPLDRIHGITTFELG